MALPSSGPLTLSNIQTEFGGSNPISLSEYYAGGGLVPSGTTGTYGAVPSSGAISIQNFYGTSNAFAFTISTNQTNADLRTLALAAGWNGTLAVQATIGAGVYVYSTSTATAALTITGSFPGGVTLINNGFVAGKGSDSVAFTSQTDNTTTTPAGGNAISLGVSCTISSASGYIGGGGGAGGSNRSGRNTGPYMTYSITGGGGAGGGAGAGTTNVCAGSSGATPDQPATVGGGPGSAGTTGTAQSTICGATRSSAAGCVGGGGGRIFPGVGGAAANGVVLNNPGSTGPGGNGGGAGGSGGAAGSTTLSGAGGSAGAAGSNTATGIFAAPGGGGWGASGGSCTSTPTVSDKFKVGGLGGKAVSLNGFTVTWTGGLPATVYGAVS